MIIEVHSKFKSSFFLLLTTLIWSGYCAASSNDVVEILESNSSQIVVSLNPYELLFTKIETNGEKYEIPQIDGYQWLNAPGKPRLPMCAILLGVPEEANPKIQILELRTSLLPSKNIYPSPQFVLSGDEPDQYFTEQTWFDNACYSQNRFYPDELIAITSIFHLRYQRIARVEIHPLQYNPVTKELRKADFLKFTVYLDETRPHSSQLLESLSTDRSSPFEIMYKNLLSNDQVARQWRQPNLRQSKTRSLSKTDKNWYDVNQTYYKLFVTEDGVYRLSFDYLNGIGIDITAIDPVTLKIYNKGKEVPLHVQGQEDGRFDPEDCVLFYGERNKGDSTFYDLYTDTNIYWLTWGYGAGLRMQRRNSIVDTVEEVTEFIERIHLEQDKIYYHGDNNIALINTEAVSGEGWIWRYFYPGESETVFIHATHLAESHRLSGLKIKLRGTTIDPIRPNHHIRVSLNNTILGDAFFYGTEDYLFDASFSSLQDGENRLELLSVGDTGAKLDQIYLDWIEVAYPGQLVAQNDYLEFSVPTEAKQLRKAMVWEFTDDDIKLFDLTNQSIIEHNQIADGKRIIFKVTSAGFSDGFFVEFRLNAEPIVAEWHRGHNLVVVDEVNGQVLDKRQFDTHLSTAESDSLAQYLQQLNPGRIVLIGIMDEGREKLTEAAYLALESLGSQLIRKLSYRDSWAMIGRKGATIGSVPEQLTPSGAGVASVKDTLVFSGNGQEYYLSFADTFKQLSRCVAFSPKGVKHPTLAKLDISANLTSQDNGADLIIITHKKFWQSAQRLAQYRAAKNGLRVNVVAVEDIYDEFNFGLLNPQAIKEFLKYTYDYWQSPSPGYVIFFGDASLDFKKNLGSHVKENYVPSYGSPVSDNWFVCFDGADDFLPEMIVGRIPVASETEAEIVVDKIIQYEHTPSAEWKKTVLFITGGFNRSEQTVFINQSNYIIDRYVLPPPPSCKVLKINKTTEGYFEGEKKYEILNAINTGTLWVNFVGHAGSRTWDLMFNHPDIEELTNANQYPFITSMTCHTGRFAEPEITSFGEHFLIAEQKGAIAFWGTSGWGFVFQDNVLLKNLFRSALVDTLHLLGKATTLAKVKLWQDYGENIYNVSTIHQYTLFGDPLTDLALPDQPDLTIGPNDVEFDPVFPTEADSTAVVKLRIRNWGLAANDSFHCEVMDIRDNETGTRLMSTITVPSLGLIDSFSINWSLKDQAGEHKIRLLIDPQHQIEEADETNNSYDYPVYVYSSKLTISKPFYFQVVNPTDLMLQINNPSISSSLESNYSYQFEIDTTDLFNSPLLISSPAITEGELVTRWKLPPLLNRTTYFWRCRTTDISGLGKWIAASFFSQPDSAYYIWTQKHPRQFAQNIFENTQLTPSGGQNATRHFILQVESAGYEDGNFARILINYEPVIEPHRGHNVVIINPRDGKVIVSKSFDTLLSEAEANAMGDLINRLPGGTYVLAGIMDEGSYRMTESAYQALESIGSKDCRHVGYRDSWAIIGIKGATIGSVKESRIPAGQGIAEVQDTLINYFTQGTITSAAIGPANRWNSFSWRPDLSGSGTNINLDVLGFNKKLSHWDTLVVNLVNFVQEDLSAINAKIYPIIKLQANLSNEGLNTPLLKEWSVSYEPVADLAIGAKVVTLSADSLMENDVLKLQAKVYNIGMITVDTVKVRLSFISPESGQAKWTEDNILTAIQVDSFKTLETTWAPIGRLGNNQIIIEVDPDDQVTELTETNNYFSEQIVVFSDTAKPQILVTYDGKPIVAGDFVSNNPIVLIQVYDDSPLREVSDTTKINLFLDNERAVYFGNEDRLSFVPIGDSHDPKLRAIVRFTPELSDGEHSLEVFVKDMRNNLNYHRDDFQVISEFTILNVFNYPNPFREDTEFTFYLSQHADMVIIKIYTVSGRLLRKLEYSNFEAGFQHIYWNGLDQDRNIMANGVYLYKIMARSGTKQVERIEKLVVMR